MPLSLCAYRQDCYPATLFRLPLRTPAQAACSEICSRVYDDAEMKVPYFVDAILPFDVPPVKLRHCRLGAKKSNWPHGHPHIGAYRVS